MCLGLSWACLKKTVALVNLAPRGFPLKNGDPRSPRHFPPLTPLRSLLASLVLVSIPSNAQNLAGPIESAKYISIGFASQNHESVPSMFGHTFLVFSREKNPEATATVVEFVGGLRDEGNGYLLRALFGLLPGQVRVRPILEREREYDLEGRDIYYFPLKLDAQANHRLRKIVQAAINSQNQNGNYGFFKENCSFVVYRWILESQNRTQPPTLAHVPLRGLRSLEQDGLISEFFIHRSIASIFSHSLRMLSREDQFQFEFFRSGGSLPPNPTPELKNSIALYSAYRIPQEPIESERYRFFGRIIDQPDLGDQTELHPLRNFHSNWIDLASGLELNHGGSGFFRIGYSPAMRNQYNTVNDTHLNSFLEMGRVRVWADREGIRLGDLTFFEMDSIPITLVSPAPLYRFIRIGYDYWTGIETAISLGPAVNSGPLSFAMGPLLGLKALGYGNGHGLNQGIHPELGLRIRTDFSLSDQFFLRLQGRYGIIVATNPDSRISSEVVFRAPTFVPFFRFERTGPIGNTPFSTNLALGGAIGF